MRFDSGHKRDSFLTETFGAFVEWVPVCPEVECGFGTPRESMRLVRGENDVRLHYRRGLVPLVVPITLFRHYVRVYDVSYLAGQRYLAPHPKELMLRNHV